MLFLLQGGPGPGMAPGGRSRGGGQGSWGPPGGEMTFSIPAHKCGLVIGRGGENVKAINQQTGAYVEISRQMPPNGDPNYKLFIIRGSPQEIDHAKQLIEEKIEVNFRPANLTGKKITFLSQPFLERFIGFFPRVLCVQ